MNTSNSTTIHLKNCSPAYIIARLADIVESLRTLPRTSETPVPICTALYSYTRPLTASKLTGDPTYYTTTAAAALDRLAAAGEFVISLAHGAAARSAVMVRVGDGQVEVILMDRVNVHAQLLYGDLVGALGDLAGDGEEPDQPEGEKQGADDVIDALAIHAIDRSGDWLTRSYTLDERIAIVRLWHRWRCERGATWTRASHAAHFHIPGGTLAGWIRDYSV